MVGVEKAPKGPKWPKPKKTAKMLVPMAPTTSRVHTFIRTMRMHSQRLPRPDAELDDAELAWWEKYADIEEEYCWVQTPQVQHLLRGSYLRRIVDLAPDDARILELGCGTGPILRWLNDRGFTGLGIDISETAVAMARDQSEGRRLRFRSADVCDPTLEGTESFDLVIDGHCLHCITTPLDRQALLRNAHRLLKPGGLFIVLTMCRPVNRVAFKRLFPGQFLRDGIIYVPSDGAGDYQGAHQIKGRQCLPTRYLGHWRAILTEIRRAEFTVQLFRYNGSTDDEPNGGLSVAALAK